MMMRWWNSVIFVLLLLYKHCCYAGTVHASLAPDVEVYAVKREDDLPTNKFTTRPLQNAFLGDASSSPNQCPFAVDLVWTNFVDSGVYSTPLIVHGWQPGLDKSIFVGGSSGHFTILDGDGHHMPGLPLTVSNTDFFSGMVTVDLDADGIDEIIWPNADAQLYILQQSPGDGLRLAGRPIAIPKLKVRRGWYETVDEMPCTDPTEAPVELPPEEAVPHEHKQDARSEDEQEVEVDYVTANKALFTAEGLASLQLLQQSDDVPTLFPEDERELLDSQFFTGSADRPRADDPDWVYVDAHIVATPTMIDINGDGCPDMVASVSYYFDDDEYKPGSEKLAALGEDTNTHMYVAGGLIIVDLLNRQILWRAHLDLTTDHTPRQAFIYGTPTVVDLDGDGGLEIIVGTSLGFIYAYHARTGQLLDDFPLAMGEVQAQIAVADVLGSGDLELIAADVRGNVLCFNKRGEELWETMLTGMISAMPTIGDIDGDSTLDVVVASDAGAVWALRGDDGTVLEGFPLKARGPIMVPVTLVSLDIEQGVRLPGLHLVFPSHDGYMYVADGRTGCINKYDIGEKTFSMVLADDILGRGKTDLLLSTMSGNLYCFASESPSSPLKSWPSQTQGGNMFTSRIDYLGVYLHSKTAHIQTVMGRTFSLTFEIVDRRNAVLAETMKEMQYTIVVRIGRRQVLYKDVFYYAGVYTVDLPSISTPESVTLTLEMTTEQGLMLSDTLQLDFNVHYYKLLKWLMVLPLCIMASLFTFHRATSYSSLGV